MSPCRRCELRDHDKDCNFCTDCDQRYLYARTLRDDIQPPVIDMAQLVMPPPKKGGSGVTRRWAGQALRKCRTKGCNRKEKGIGAEYCHKCSERRRQRAKRGIPLDLQVRGGAGNPFMARGKRAKNAFDPVGA